MIINNRRDLDNAPEQEREKFLRKLAAGVNRWHWVDGEWQLQQHMRQLERFGLTIDDIPAPPTPEKPAYNPHERARDQLAAEIREQRDRLLWETDYAVIPDSPHDTPETREYRQALRDVPQQANFPGNVTWPEKPEALPE